MKKTIQRTVLATVMALGISGMAMASGLGALNGPGVNYTGFDWLATTYNGAYAVVPNDVKSVVDPATKTATYNVQIKEVFNPWSVRQEILPGLAAQGMPVEAYANYAYSLADYQVKVAYQYKDDKEVAPSIKTYYVAKTGEQDFTQAGLALGPKRSYNGQFVKVEPGSDEYKIAYELEKGYFNDDVVHKMK